MFCYSKEQISGGTDTSTPEVIRMILPGEAHGKKKGGTEKNNIRN
jgi:hypothetical protein